MKTLLHIALIFLALDAMLACLYWASKIGGSARSCIPTVLTILALGAFAWLVTHLPRRRRA